MSKIEQRLKALFKESRIVVWQDEGGSLKDEFNSLNLDAIKLELNNNEFGIKVKVLYEDTKSNFLIYSQNGEPNIEEDWLLDIKQSFHKFSADPISMIVSELELDFSKKTFICEHKAFFNAKSRFEKYKSLIASNDSDSELLFKMISVVINCEDNLENIVLKLIEKKELLDELNKYNLTNKLLKELELNFEYKATALSIDDFTYKLLQNHFYSYTDKTKGELNKKAIELVNSWMDSNRYKELYKTISQNTQKELNIENIITSFELKDIIDCSTYEICEKFVISKIRDLIVESKIDDRKYEEYFEKREHKFWYDKYENIYKTFFYAIKLDFAIKDFQANIEDFEEGIEKYSKKWYEIDLYYRKFQYFYDKSSHKEVLKSLNILEDAYMNSYLRVLNDKWQEFVQDYSFKNSKHQRAFYETNISKIVEKNQKAFVIISDALRFECAKELSSIISYENTENRSFSVKEDYMISSLPSYTQLGMAALLPNSSLEIKDDDTVYVDGKSSKGKVARLKILQAYENNSIVFKDEEFLSLNRNTGRDALLNKNVVYIYHNEIDAVGDDPITEDKVFEAVESSFETIKKIVKHIVNLNGTNIFITADHGFLYTATPTNESDFCKIDTSFMQTSKVNRRFVIGKSLKENSCTQFFSSKELGIDGENEFLITKSINKLSLRGGGNRFVHGGATLQELVIPLLEIKYQRKNVVKDVDATILPISTITTNSVNISIYQEEAICDNIKPITIECAFYSEDMVLLSDKHKLTLDSSDSENRNRESKLRFNFKDTASQYSGKFIKFIIKKVIENSSEKPIYKTFDIKLQLAFFSDFDEF